MNSEKKSLVVAIVLVIALIATLATIILIMQSEGEPAANISDAESQEASKNIETSKPSAESAAEPISIDISSTESTEPSEPQSVEQSSEPSVEQSAEPSVEPSTEQSDDYSEDTQYKGYDFTQNASSVGINKYITDESVVIFTTDSSIKKGNTNWAVNVLLKCVGKDKYNVVKVVVGSGESFSQPLQNDQILLSVHSTGKGQNKTGAIKATNLDKGDLVVIRGLGDKKVTSIIAVTEIINGDDTSDEPSEDPSDEPSDDDPNAIKIMIDAGHFVKGSNKGVVDGYYEGLMSWKLQGYLKAALEKYGFVVGTTRQSENEEQNTEWKGVSWSTAEEWTIKWRAENEARGKCAKGYDMFISLHSNSLPNYPSYRRAVIYIPMDSNSAQRELGNNIGKAMQKVMNLPLNESSKKYPGYEVTPRRDEDDPSKEYYAVMRAARSVGCPMYMIIENSFHTNPESCAWLLKDENLISLAEVQAKEIAVYYGKT